MLNTVAGATMAGYPSILLAGEMRFSSFFIRELEKALLSGVRMPIIHVMPNHWEWIGSTHWQKTGRLHVVQPPATSEKHEALAIHEEGTQEHDSTLTARGRIGGPYPISNQSQPGRLGGGVDQQRRGLQGQGDQPARIHPATAHVVLKPNPSTVMTGGPRGHQDTPLTRNAEGLILVDIPPGESRFVFLPTAKVGGKQAP